MKFNSYMPTQIIDGDNVVIANSDKFKLGSKCLIVCGKNSARLCGALDDVEVVLKQNGIQYTIFNRIMENPLMSVCYEGGRLASEFGANFIVAIGGGSPIDAAKAIAAFATNTEIEPSELYTAELKPSLPIIAIPTTAGTGSEVNPFSVITLDGQNIKKTFKHPNSYPRYAFLDRKYADSLSLDYTVSTALDAFSHCVESYLSPKATIHSLLYAMFGAQQIYTSLKAIEHINKDNAIEELRPWRYALMLGSCAGGIAINTTGTGFTHPLGYNLTLYKGVSHGRACGAFMQEYFAYNQRSADGASLLDKFCATLGDSPSAVAENIVRWSNVNIKLTDAEISEYINNVKDAGNYANSPYVINTQEMISIYKKLFN